MKGNIALILLLISFNFTAIAQSNNQTPKLGCIDPVIRLQASKIKQHYEKQGFKTIHDAMITMESNEPYPVMPQLHKGQLYQIIFVANPNETRMNLTIFDGDDVKIDEKLFTRGRENPNYIIYTFVPPKSDVFLFVMRQKYKNKSICGSFTILTIDGNFQEGKIIPYSGH